MAQKTEAVASRIDPEVKDRLERAAAECDLTLSTYIGTVIEAHVSRNPNDLRALQQQPAPGQNGSEESNGAYSADDFVDEMLADL